MNAQQGATAGLAAVATFTIALFGFAALRSDYSHFTKAVSELGVIGAPNALAWNVIGFITTGVLLTLCGMSIARAIDGRRSVLWYLLMLAGVGFALTGVFPAEMVNGDPLMQSPWTIAHLVAVLLSSLFWMLAAFLLPWRTRRNPQWQSFTMRAVVLALVCAAGSLINSLLLPTLLPPLQFMPGISQRIGFALCLVWYVVLALQLLRRAVAEKLGEADRSNVKQQPATSRHQVLQ